MLAAFRGLVVALDLGERGERRDGLHLAPAVAEQAEELGAAQAVAAELGEVAAEHGEHRAQAQ